MQRILPVVEWGWLEQEAQLDSARSLLEFVEAIGVGVSSNFCENATNS